MERTTESFVWTLDRGVVDPTTLPPRAHWEWRDDYAGNILDGLYFEWSEALGGWIIRTLDAQIDRFIFGIRVMTGVDLRPRRAEIKAGLIELIQKCGPIGRNGYIRPNAGNVSTAKGVGAPMSLRCMAFIQPIGKYLDLPPGHWGATLWWAQVQSRFGGLSREVKVDTAYAGPAREKRLLHKDLPDRIPANEIILASPVQLGTKVDPDMVHWSETSGSRIVYVKGEKHLCTSHPHDMALKSTSLHIVVQAICDELGITLEQSHSSIGDLRRSPGVALCGSWTKWVHAQGLLVGQDPRVLYAEDELRLAACEPVGHAPAPMDIDFGTKPHPLIIQIGEEYDALLQGTSTLECAKHLVQLVRPSST